jgi:TRAP transporter TAXI family solute receptor
MAKLIAVATLTLPALLVGGPANAQTTNLSIATGGTGGVYYPLGGGIATEIRENVDGYDATVQETNASVDNILLLQTGAAHLALVVGDTAAAAVAGEAPFEGPVEICAIGNLYNNYMQVVTTADSGIESVADLEGKIVSVGAPGSATEVGAVRVLEAAGLGPDADIDRRQLGAAETVAALRDGTIDAGFWSGGLPTGALVDLASTGEMKIIPIGEHAAALGQKYGGYYMEMPIPADTYQGQSEPVSTIASPNVLVVRTDMEESLQQAITGAIFDNKEDLIQVHPAAKELDASTAGEISFIETCPGAKAYYDQKRG